MFTVTIDYRVIDCVRAHWMRISVSPKIATRGPLIATSLIVTGIRSRSELHLHGEKAELIMPGGDASSPIKQRFPPYDIVLL